MTPPPLIEPLEHQFAALYDRRRFLPDRRPLKVNSRCIQPGEEKPPLFKKA
jgi:hypothetical protein